MPVEFAGANVVVTARQFNPSILSQMWLARHEIIAQDAPTAGCLFSEAVVLVNNEQFNLLVVPPQLQLTPSANPHDEAELIARVAGGIVGNLPETPYQAVGLNFQWFLWSDNRSMNDITRALFFEATRPTYRRFDSGDAKFGGYFSKDVFGCRLKLDVKPTMVEKEGQKLERLLFAFNYHLDAAGEGAATTIVEHLGRWNAARQEADQIVNEALSVAVS